MGRHYWYRNTDWNEQVEEAFFAKFESTRQLRRSTTRAAFRGAAGDRRAL